MQFIADLFNVMNANTEIARERNAGSTNFGVLGSNLSPRILRFGLRANFLGVGRRPSRLGSPTKAGSSHRSRPLSQKRSSQSRRLAVDDRRLRTGPSL